MEVRWGTDSPIQVRDPVLNIATSVQARGAYRIQIADAVRFLNRLLGHGAKSFTQEDLSQFFRTEFQQLIKSSITGEIRKSKEEILGICARQTDLAEQIAPLLASPLAEIGLELLSFSIGSIDIPKTDPNRQMLEESFARRGVRVQEAHAKREEQEILEIAWAQRESAEILRDVANNPGAGGIAAAGAGLGVGVAAGSVFGTMAQQMFAPLQPGQAAPAGPAAASAGRFVQKSAAREDAEPPVSPDDPVIKIKQLKSMLDIGAISQEEYDSKKKEILDRL
jgi:membrane protease subunit (stomatin/prohibitin family)